MLSRNVGFYKWLFPRVVLHGGLWATLSFPSPLWNQPLPLIEQVSSQDFCIIKMITCFLVLVLEYFELLWLSVVPQFLEVNKDLEGRWAHDGLRVMWLTGGRPGFWSPVFGLPGQCSVLRLPLLPQPPLRLRVKRCFSDNSSVLLCHPLPTEYFFFPCMCYKYFKTTNIEYDWRVVESVTWECAFLTQGLFLADFFFLRNRRNCKDRAEVTLLWGTFTLMKEISICKGVFLPVPKREGCL